jgi:hypothetical protein
MLVLRRHLNADWNLFVDHLTSLNEDTFASDNDDEDTALLATTLFGAGLNLWRGEKTTSFQEIQLGAGARYQYDYVDFEERRNRFEPVIGVVYRAQEVPFWIGTLDLSLAFITPPGDFERFSVWSSSALSFPLADRWEWRNAITARYRNTPVEVGYPSVYFQMSSGVTYSF